MLPLAGSVVAASPEQLITALQSGLQAHQIEARDVQAVGQWPNLSAVKLDLTGAQFTRSTRLPRGSGASEADLSIEAFSILGSPLLLEGTPLHVELRASMVRAGFVRDSDQRLILALNHVASGSLTMSIHRNDLESALKRVAAETASGQGADVKAAHVEFTNRGPRSLDFRAEVTAKVFVMTAKLTLTGKVDVDGDLNLRAHDLKLTGDGMMASVASGFLRPKCEELEKRSFPLGAFSVAGLKLHDVRLTGGDGLRLEAQFAG